MKFRVASEVWRYVVVFVILAILSFLFERGLHYLTKYLKKRNRFHLIELINKVSHELIISGVTSFLVFLIASNVNIGEHNLEEFALTNNKIFMLAVAPIIGICCVLISANFERKKFRKAGRNSTNAKFNTERAMFIKLMKLDNNFDYVGHLEVSYKHGVVSLGDFNILMWILYIFAVIIDAISVSTVVDVVKIIFVQFGLVAIAAIAYTVIYWKFQRKLQYLQTADLHNDFLPSINDNEVTPSENTPFFKRLKNLFPKSKKVDQFHLVKRQLKSYILWMTRIARIVVFWFSIVAFNWAIDAIVYEFQWISFGLTFGMLVLYCLLFLPFFRSLYFAWGYLVKPHFDPSKRLSTFLEE